MPTVAMPALTLSIVISEVDLPPPVMVTFCAVRSFTASPALFSQSEMAVPALEFIEARPTPAENRYALAITSPNSIVLEASFEANVYPVRVPFAVFCVETTLTSPALTAPSRSIAAFCSYSLKAIAKDTFTLAAPAAALYRAE